MEPVEVKAKVRENKAFIGTTPQLRGENRRKTGENDESARDRVVFTN